MGKSLLGPVQWMRGDYEREWGRKKGGIRFSLAQRLRGDYGREWGRIGKGEVSSRSSAVVEG